MNEILKEFYEAVAYLKERCWEIQFFIDCETTGQPIVPYILVVISDKLKLSVVLNDTYYVDLLYTYKKDKTAPLGQVTYTPEGNLSTSKEKLVEYKKILTDSEGALLDKFIKDLYYFFKPNSINFLME